MLQMLQIAILILGDFCGLCDLWPVGQKLKHHWHLFLPLELSGLLAYFGITSNHVVRHDWVSTRIKHHKSSRLLKPCFPGSGRLNNQFVMLNVLPWSNPVFICFCHTEFGRESGYNLSPVSAMWWKLAQFPVCPIAWQNFPLPYHGGGFKYVASDGNSCLMIPHLDLPSLNKPYGQAQQVLHFVVRNLDVPGAKSRWVDEVFNRPKTFQLFDRSTQIRADKIVVFWYVSLFLSDPAEISAIPVSLETVGFSNNNDMVIGNLNRSLCCRPSKKKRALLRERKTKPRSCPKFGCHLSYLTYDCKLLQISSWQGLLRIFEKKRFEPWNLLLAEESCDFCPWNLLSSFFPNWKTWRTSTSHLPSPLRCKEIAEAMSCWCRACYWRTRCDKLINCRFVEMAVEI